MPVSRQALLELADRLTGGLRDLLQEGGLDGAPPPLLDRIGALAREMTVRRTLDDEGLAALVGRASLILHDARAWRGASLRH